MLCLESTELHLLPSSNISRHGEQQGPEGKESTGCIRMRVWLCMGLGLFLAVLGLRIGTWALHDSAKVLP